MIPLDVIAITSCIILFQLIIFLLCKIWLIHNIWHRMLILLSILRVFVRVEMLLLLTYRYWVLRMWTSLSCYYLVVFQYDHDLPSYDHSGVCFLPEPLHNRYTIYKFPSIYMTRDVRNRVPIRLCSHGMSMITRLNCHPITLETCHHLLVFCRILGHLSS